MRLALPALPFLACLLLLLGCAQITPPTARDNRVAPTLPGLVPAGSLVVLAPAEQNDVLLKSGNPLLLNQLHRQLVAAGYRVAALDAANHDTVWRQEVDAAGGIYDPASGQLRAAAYAQAVGTLARRVCAEARCALLLRYRLVTRKATLAGTTAEWDGQRRHQPISGSGGLEGRFYEGSTEGLSVELQGLDARGEFVLRSHGGSSLPFRVDLNSRKYELRTDLFDNDAEIADGVRLALAPLLQLR